MKAAAETLNDKHLRRWGIPLIVLMALIGLMPFFFPGRWDLFFIYFPAGLLYTSLTWEICRWILIQVRLQLPGVANTRRRIFRSTLLFILIAGLGQLMLNAFFHLSGLTPPGLAASNFWALWLINLAAALFFVLLNSSIYEAMYFFGQYKSLIQKAEQLKKQQARQRLDALKSRVNPHFLFNSLTTLSALIAENPPQAERFVNELSKVYRYLLRAGREEKVTLADELQFADSYVFLLQNRFENGVFSVEKTWSEEKYSSNSESMLPALGFQNALDYLVRTQNTPLHIKIDLTKAEVQLRCRHQPKMRSFNKIENDWQPLQNQGASRLERAGELLISITLSPPNDAR